MQKELINLFDLKQVPKSASEAELDQKLNEYPSSICKQPAAGCKISIRTNLISQ